MVDNWLCFIILCGQVVWDRDNGGILGDKSYGQFFKRLLSFLDRIWDIVEKQGLFDVVVF